MSLFDIFAAKYSHLEARWLWRGQQEHTITKATRQNNIQNQTIHTRNYHHMSRWQFI